MKLEKIGILLNRFGSTDKVFIMGPKLFSLRYLCFSVGRHMCSILAFVLFFSLTA